MDTPRMDTPRMENDPLGARGSEHAARHAVNENLVKNLVNRLTAPVFASSMTVPGRAASVGG
jgi:hypothetical protein